MIVSWAGHIRRPGSICAEFGHVVDIAPTVFQAAHVTAPEMVNGVKQKPLDGQSLMPSSVHAELNLASDHASGVVLALGSKFAGWGLYLDQGRPTFVYAPSMRPAGSYTPFTLSLPGAWGWGMTTAVWSLAILGALGKLFLRGVDRKFWVAVYLTLGWLVVVALKPMIDHLAWYALVLLLAGGVVYSTGVIFYVNKRLKFARAIWHGHVLAGAAAHWAAVLLGVVLAAH